MFDRQSILTSYRGEWNFRHSVMRMTKPSGPLDSRVSAGFTLGVGNALIPIISITDTIDFAIGGHGGPILGGNSASLRYMFR